MRPHDDSFHALLRLQAGAASIEQALQIGFSPAEIDHRRRVGRWVTLLPGVVSVPGVPETWDRELIAGCLFLGDRGVASHATAARLLGLEPFAQSTDVQFTVQNRQRSTGSRLHVHSARVLTMADRTTFHRAVPGPKETKLPLLRTIHLTSASRTIIDLAGITGADVLGNTIDDAVRRGRTSPEHLVKRLRELGPRTVKGSRRLSELMLDAGGHSWLERRFLRLLRLAGLPRPRTQVVFRNDGVTVARVDFLFEGTNVIAEVSGRRGHASEADRKVDARRRNDLQRSGHVVIEFVTSDVIDDERYVLDTLSVALRGESLRLTRSRT